MEKRINEMQEAVSVLSSAGLIPKGYESKVEEKLIAASAKIEPKYLLKGADRVAWKSKKGKAVYKLLPYVLYCAELEKKQEPTLEAEEADYQAFKKFDEEWKKAFKEEITPRKRNDPRFWFKGTAMPVNPLYREWPYMVCRKSAKARRITMHQLCAELGLEYESLVW